MDRHLQLLWVSTEEHTVGSAGFVRSRLASTVAAPLGSQQPSRRVLAAPHPRLHLLLLRPRAWTLLIGASWCLSGICCCRGSGPGPFSSGCRGVSVAFAVGPFSSGRRGVSVAFAVVGALGLDRSHRVVVVSQCCLNLHFPHDT